MTEHNNIVRLSLTTNNADSNLQQDERTRRRDATAKGA